MIEDNKTIKWMGLNYARGEKLFVSIIAVILMLGFYFFDYIDPYQALDPKIYLGVMIGLLIFLFVMCFKIVSLKNSKASLYS